MSEYHVNQKVYYGLYEFIIKEINLDNDTVKLCRTKDGSEGFIWVLSIGDLNEFYSTTAYDSAIRELDRLISYVEEFSKDFVSNAKKTLQFLKQEKRKNDV